MTKPTDVAMTPPTDREATPESASDTRTREFLKTEMKNGNVRDVAGLAARLREFAAAERLDAVALARSSAIAATRLEVAARLMAEEIIATPHDAETGAWGGYENYVEHAAKLIAANAAFDTKEKP